MDDGYTRLHFVDTLGMYQRQALEIGIHPEGGRIVIRWGMTRWIWFYPPTFALPAQQQFSTGRVLQYIRTHGFTALAEVEYVLSP